MLFTLLSILTNPSFANTANDSGAKTVFSPVVSSTSVEASSSFSLNESWHLDENGDMLQRDDLLAAARQMRDYINESVETSHCYQVLLEHTQGACDTTNVTTALDLPGFRQDITCTTGGNRFVVVSSNLPDSLSSSHGEFLCKDSDFVFHIKRRQRTQ